MKFLFSQPVIEPPLAETPLIKNEQMQSIYSVSEEEYDPLKPNDYEKLVEDLKKRKLYEDPHPMQIDEKPPAKSRNDNRRMSSSDNNSNKNGRYNEENRYGSGANNNGNKTSKDNTFFKPRYDDEDYEKDFSGTKRSTAGAAFAPPPSLIEESKKQSDNEEYESPFQNTQKSVTSVATAPA